MESNNIVLSLIALSLSASLFATAKEPLKVSQSEKSFVPERNPNCSMPKSLVGLSDDIPDFLGDPEIYPQYLPLKTERLTTFKVTIKDKGFVPGSLALDEVDLKALSSQSAAFSTATIHYVNGAIPGEKSKEVANQKNLPDSEKCPNSNGEVFIKAQLFADKVGQKGFRLRAMFKNKKQVVVSVGSSLGLVEFKLNPPKHFASIVGKEIIFRDEKNKILKKVSFEPSTIQTKAAGVTHDYLEEPILSSDRTAVAVLRTNTAVDEGCDEEGCGKIEQSIEVLNSTGSLYKLHLKNQVGEVTENGIANNGEYLIVSLKDSDYVGGHPELAIFDKHGNKILTRAGETLGAELSPDGNVVAWRGLDFIEFINIHTKANWKYKSKDPNPESFYADYSEKVGFVVISNGKQVAVCPICKPNASNK